MLNRFKNKIDFEDELQNELTNEEDSLESLKHDRNSKIEKFVKPVSKYNSGVLTLEELDNKISNNEQPKSERKFALGLQHGIDNLVSQKDYETARNRNTIKMLEEVNKNALISKEFRSDKKIENGSKLRSNIDRSSSVITDVAITSLDHLKHRVVNILQDYQLREKRLIARCKSLEFEVGALKSIIKEMRNNHNC